MRTRRAWQGYDDDRQASDAGGDRGSLGQCRRRHVGQHAAPRRGCSWTLQKFALDHELLDRPVFGKLENPPVGQRDRVPTTPETEAILTKASPQFRLIYLALRQCGAQPGEFCRATIADIDRAADAIVLKDHKTARKTGKPHRVPIGLKLGELIRQAIGDRQAGPIFLSPSGNRWTIPNLSRTYSGCAIWPACRAIWSCIWPGTNAVRRFAGKRGSSTPAGCWGTPTSRRRSGTCTSTTGSLRRRRIWSNSNRCLPARRYLHWRVVR